MNSVWRLLDGAGKARWNGYAMLGCVAEGRGRDDLEMTLCYTGMLALLSREKKAMHPPAPIRNLSGRQS